jgi:hypothetical protein
VLRARVDGPARKVRAARLSSYITKPVDLLKIDIEGAETEVISELHIAGKLKFIKQAIVEYHHHIDKDSDSLSVMLGILEAAGFGYQIGAALPEPFKAGQFQDVIVHAYNKNTVR